MAERGRFRFRRIRAVRTRISHLVKFCAVAIEAGDQRVDLARVLQQLVPVHTGHPELNVDPEGLKEPQEPRLCAGTSDRRVCGVLAIGTFSAVKGLYEFEPVFDRYVAIGVILQSPDGEDYSTALIATC